VGVSEASTTGGEGGVGVGVSEASTTGSEGGVGVGVSEVSTTGGEEGVGGASGDRFWCAKGEELEGNG